MVEYKLTYLNVRGLGEAIRWVFYAAKVTFEDDRIEFDENWHKSKLENPRK